MPSISFVLPHWLYWSGLVFFPLIAAWLAARQMKDPPDGRPTYAIAYLFWALAGYLGIHRFYLRSAWGFVFIPFFLGIVLGRYLFNIKASGPGQGLRPLRDPDAVEDGEDEE